jgi:WD40 repeat protein
VLPNAPRGLALAREKGWLLAWDEQDWLYLLDQNGERQAQLHFPGTLTTACSADDGSSYAAGGSQGEICWLSPDLRQRWARSIADPVLAMAQDPFGQYLAVSDPRGNLHLLDRTGRTITLLQSPRPLHHLAFIPTARFLLGCSNYGLVACFDLKGRWIWRDSPVAHIGSLACSEDGNPIVLACFSEGLQRYSLTGRNLGRQSFAEACRLVTLTFDGQLLLMAGLGHRLFLLDAQFTTLASQTLDKPIVSLAFSALGNCATAALSQGPLVRLNFHKP